MRLDVRMPRCTQTIVARVLWPRLGKLDVGGRTTQGAARPAGGRHCMAGPTRSMAAGVQHGRMLGIYSDAISASEQAVFEVGVPSGRSR